MSCSWLISEIVDEIEVGGIACLVDGLELSRHLATAILIYAINATSLPPSRRISASLCGIR